MLTPPGRCHLPSHCPPLPAAVLEVEVVVVVVVVQLWLLLFLLLLRSGPTSRTPSSARALPAVGRAGEKDGAR